ncbi:hemin uptake protein HemP [Ottowia testudinis]|uniref:Hemin uptake protein HemP n=1 Tax=Ottowia testudinis TaxID=2816950 RepID=A0A975CDP2_9BURK|nr:hemin uptake protein HemP [Ottowia testudinis]QTD44350.1 hemin uptake protein HemP [Ottowia testudinis]
MDISKRIKPVSVQLGHKPVSVQLGHKPNVLAGHRVSSMQLLGNRHEVEIEHEGGIYRLRLTKAGKLILTK